MDLAKFKIFDEVRIKAAPVTYDEDFKPPEVGDVGVVVYKSPSAGYGIEKVGPDGRIAWQADFLPDQLEAA
jgi:hypothetical protein